MPKATRIVTARDLLMRKVELLNIDLFEDDTFDDADEIGIFNLTEAVDIEWIIRVRHESSGYAIMFFVVSAEILQHALYPVTPPGARLRALVERAFWTVKTIINT